MMADVEVEALCPVLILLRDFANETGYVGPVQLIIYSPMVPKQFLDFFQHTTQHISIDLA